MNRRLALIALLMVGPAAASAGRGAGERLDSIRAMAESGRGGEAIEAGRAAIILAAEVHGARSVEVADAIDTLVFALWVSGQRRAEETLARAEEVVALRVELLGEDHPSVAESRRRLGSIYLTAGRSDEAEGQLVEALRVAEAAEPDSLLVAAVLENTSALADERNQRALALALAERALAIREQRLGDSLLVSESLSTVGNMLYYQGRLSDAANAYEQAVEVARRAIPAQAPRTAHGDPGHGTLGRALHNLALVRHALGEIAPALDAHQRSLAMSMLLFGPAHHKTGSDHLDLGRLERDLGDFPSAQEHFERAREALAHSYGIDHPEYAAALAALGSLARDRGDLERSLELLEEALRITVASVDRSHPATAAVLIELGETSRAAGDSERASERLTEAVSTLRRSAPGSAELVLALVALADLAAESDPEAADGWAGEALERGQGLAPDHLLVARALLVRARAASRRSELATAAELAEQGLAVVRRTIGAAHPLAAELQIELACVRARAGHPGDALRLAAEASAVLRRQVVTGVDLLPEREGLLFASLLRRSDELATAALSALATPSAAEVELALDTVVRSRGIVLEGIARRHSVLAESADPTVRDLQRRWLEARQRHAGLLVRHGGELPAAAIRESLEQAERDVERAEVEIARHLALGRSFAEEGLPEVREALGQTRQLVSLVRYASDGCPCGGQPPRYAAFILTGGDAEARFIALGAAAELEAAVDELRTSYERAGASGEEVRHRQIGARVRAMAWDPLGPLLHPDRPVSMVPEGTLTFVDIQALPAERGGYLAETVPAIAYRMAERDLIPRRARPTGTGVLAVGAPSFDHSEARLASASGGTGAESTGGARPLFGAVTRSAPRCGQFASTRFESLPETAGEVAALREIWNGPAAAAGRHDEVLLLLGPQATEAAVKRNAPGRRLLHLATHGMSLDPHCSLPRSAAGATGNGEVAAIGFSGLALAGANQRALSASDEEDGILTAGEIAALDLSAVELAVLSACDGGTGRVQLGEGVLGLRRALHVAGVQEVVVSLGPIEDRTARAWMTSFYERLAAQAMSTGEAARAASLELLEAARGEDEPTHPARWAPFVVSRKD